MDNKKDILALIETYLEGSLPPKEKSDFEIRLKNDKELAEVWKLNQQVDRALQPKKMNMVGLLEGIGEEFAGDYRPGEEEVARETNSGNRPLFVVILFGIITLSAVFFWWQSKEAAAPSPQRIFAEAYEPYPISATVRSADNPLSSALETARKQYQDGEYAAAITSLDALLQDGNSTGNDVVEIRFYKGLAHLGNEDAESARQELDIVLASGNLGYMQQTQWYLALIELRNDNPTAAKAYLNDILKIATAGKYAKQAESLLEQLGG